MQPISLSYSISAPDTLAIDGFPDAVWVGALNGEDSQRLSDLALHNCDLAFARECLDCLVGVTTEPIRSALWHSAIVNCMKCFGRSKSRFKLNPSVVFQGDPDAMEVFSFFKALRDKHYVHDENAAIQAIPVAVVNRLNASPKIAQITNVVIRGDFIGTENFQNLTRLVAETQAWVDREHDNIADQIKLRMEAMSHSDLLALPKPEYRKAETNNIAVTRASL